MKILVLANDDPILSHTTNAFNRLGHEAKILRIDQKGFDDFQFIANEFRPDFCLTANFYLIDAHPDAARFEEFFIHECPLAIWQFEVPTASGSKHFHKRLNDGQVPRTFLWFLTDSFYVEDFKQRGLTAYHLPLAVDPALEFFKPSNQSSSFEFSALYVGKAFPSKNFDAILSADISGAFVDQYRRELTNHLFNISTKTEEARTNIHNLDQIIRPHLTIFFKSFYKDQSQYNAGFKQLVSDVKGLMTEPSWDFVELHLPRLHWIYSHYHHILSLNCHLKRGLRIFGGDDWKFWLPHYPHKTPRLTEAELLTAYHQSKVTLCLTKFQFQNFVHDRTMAVLGAGGFPLTDYRKDLDLMFEKDEMARYRDVEEAGEFIDYFNKNLGERRRIVEKGRKRLFNEHTYLHRAKQILNKLGTHAG